MSSLMKSLRRKNTQVQLSNNCHLNVYLGPQQWDETRLLFSFGFIWMLHTYNACCYSGRQQSL